MKLKINKKNLPTLVEISQVNVNTVVEYRENYYLLLARPQIGQNRYHFQDSTCCKVINLQSGYITNLDKTTLVIPVQTELIIHKQ